MKITLPICQAECQATFGDDKLWEVNFSEDRSWLSCMIQTLGSFLWIQPVLGGYPKRDGGCVCVCGGGGGGGGERRMARRLPHDVTAILSTLIRAEIDAQLAPDPPACMSGRHEGRPATPTSLSKHSRLTLLPSPFMYTTTIPGTN